MSRLGVADLHKIVISHDRMYALDAVLSAMVISEDGGRTFSEHFTPRGLIIDFDVDPATPHAWWPRPTAGLPLRGRGRDLAAARAQAEGMRLAWPERRTCSTGPTRTERAPLRGQGRHWEDVGRVDGEPYKFEAIGEEHLYLALSDGTITQTTDGARSWEAVFEP